jgi:dTDP-glucose 4,6-dehydratase
LKTLLVTGGAGFIGSHFIRYWLGQHPDGYIVNLDLLTYAGNPANLSDVAQHLTDRYAFVHGDIANRELVRYLLDRYTPDAIVNFAAESHNSRAIVDPMAFYRTNVLGTQNLLECAQSAGGVRVHHVSTCEVYGDLALDSSEKFTESSPLRPRTPYNASKAAADLAVRAFQDTFGLPITISNCSNNYGTHQFPEKVIPHFCARALRGLPLTLYRQSHNRREWLHVVDHCRAIDLILQGGRIGETYNVGSGVEADVEQIAELVISELGLDPKVAKTYVADRPGHDRRYLLDSSKIRRELEWEPTVPFEDGVRSTIRWYHDNPSWWEPLMSRLAVAEDSWVRGPVAGGAVERHAT